MSIPKVAGIETEYAVMIVGANESDPFLASELILDAYQHIGKPAIPCQPYTREHTLLSRKAMMVTGEDAHSASLRRERAAHYARGRQSADMSDIMLVNGARFYIDHAHPEYSTPECLSPRTLVAADKAGERILAGCQHWLNVTEALPRGQSVRLYKNNSDYKDNSYGCHENYLLSAELFNNLLHRKTHQVFRYLLPFLVTRNILCGSGKVGSENGMPPAGFQLSQRADFFETLIGLQTTQERPLFNTRDEAHADRTRFRRLHVIPGDANMAEFSTYLKVGMTQLMLQMLEDDFIRRDLTIADPLGAMHAVSRDLTFQQTLEMEDGTSMTALDIQYIFLELAHRYLTERGGSEEQQEILNVWEDALDMLPQDWQLLSTRFDWAVKKRLLDRYLDMRGAVWEEVKAWQRIIEMPVADDTAKASAEQAGLAWSDYEKQRELYFALRRLDLEYHDIRYNADLGEVGLFYHLQQLGAIERLVTEQEIQERVTSPSPDTRSWLRGQCIARFPHTLVSADWSGLHFRLAGQDKYLDLPDPGIYTESELRPVWEQMDNLSSLIKHLTSEGDV